MRNLTCILVMVLFAPMVQAQELFAYEMKCSPLTPNPYLALTASDDINHDLYRVWYTVGIRELEVISFENGDNDAMQFLRGLLRDSRGRQTYAEHKETGELTNIFFVRSDQWDCALNRR